MPIIFMGNKAHHMSINIKETMYLDKEYEAYVTAMPTMVLL